MPLLLLLLLAIGCGSPRAPERTLTVFNAGSLARPMRAVLDTFARREGVAIGWRDAAMARSFGQRRQQFPRGAKLALLQEQCDFETAPFWGRDRRLRQQRLPPRRLAGIAERAHQPAGKARNFGDVVGVAREQVVDLRSFPGSDCK